MSNKEVQTLTEKPLNDLQSPYDRVRMVFRNIGSYLNYLEVHHATGWWPHALNAHIEPEEIVYFQVPHILC